MATVKDMLKCPKCRKQMMGKAHPQKWGREYFAHCCHEYFGIDELIYNWGYDAGDLFGYVLDEKKFVAQLREKYYPSSVKSVPINFFSPTEYDGETGEPYWLSGYERSDAYAMVNRMFLGIPELDDYQDLQRTHYDALGIWVQ